MARSRTGVLLFALLLGGSRAGAETWRIFHNDRFGATAEVPAAWRMDPAPENNDGRSFSSPDGRAKIVVSGIRAEIGSLEEDKAIRLKPDVGEVVTYEKRGGGWIVVSGTRGDTIFYRKSILTCGDSIWDDLSIEYPAAEAGKYAALVKRVSASLRGGKAYDADGCG